MIIGNREFNTENSIYIMGILNVTPDSFSDGGSYKGMDDVLQKAGRMIAEGATVKKDQPILVLEAMKMDNDIVAPCDGVVSFAVAKGANVESDSVLAVIS